MIYLTLQKLHELLEKLPVGKVIHATVYKLEMLDIDQKRVEISLDFEIPELESVTIELNAE